MPCRLVPYDDTGARAAPSFHAFLEKGGIFMQKNARILFLLILLLILMFHPKEQSPEPDPQCCIIENNTLS